MVEAWKRPPASSPNDMLFGIDKDLDVAAQTHESWDRPLPPLFTPLFEEQIFPDMTLSLPFATDRVYRHANRLCMGERARDKLPEFSLNNWVDPPPLKAPLLAPALPPGPRMLALADRRPASPARAGAIADRPARPEERRARGKLEAERSLVSVEAAQKIDQQCNNPALAHLDNGLTPIDFEAQLVGCIEFPEGPGAAKRVWVRTPSDTKLSVTGAPEHEACLKEFQTPELSVAACCLNGSRGAKDVLPNQDNYSMTSASSDRAVYVVCDGHGPVGHIVSFRVAQSLPKMVLDGLQVQSTERLPERVLLEAFELASVDLAAFANEHRLDISASGTTCAAVLRLGPSVFVAWVGEARPLIASLVEEGSKLDFLATAHTTDNPAERQRVSQRGAELLPIPPNNALRVFAKGMKRPGVYTTRALGDSLGRDLGLSAEPDVTKCSFDTVPGFVFLGTGGLWEVLPNGEAVIHLLTAHGSLQQERHQEALARLTDTAQKIWKREEDGCYDDLTCVLLHWSRAAPLPPPPPPPPSYLVASPALKGAAHDQRLAAEAVSRAKPTTSMPTPSQELATEIERQFNSPNLVRLDAGLMPPGCVAQVVGCVDIGEPFNSEKPAWLRTAERPEPERMNEGQSKWIKKFEPHGIRVAACCRGGQRPAGGEVTNQDNYSITHGAGDMTLYVVCDGHGPLGHLVSFRLVQSLPKLVFGNLEDDAERPPEDVIYSAFEAACQDLVRFAGEQNLDISCSGATCSTALRRGGKVHVAWLGDSRALIATVVGSIAKVDLMTRPHLVDDAAERARLMGKGLDVCTKSQEDAVRVYPPGKQFPGLRTSRAFGNSSLSGPGVLSQPEMTKTSFEDVPGLVLLGSGGLCEFFQDGSSVLSALIQEGQLLERGPFHALSCLCSTAQAQWLQSEDTYCEDITGLLIHWVGNGRQASNASTEFGSGVGSSSIRGPLLGGRDGDCAAPAASSSAAASAPGSLARRGLRGPSLSSYAEDFSWKPAGAASSSLVGSTRVATTRQPPALSAAAPRTRTPTQMVLGQPVAPPAARLSASIPSSTVGTKGPSGMIAKPQDGSAPIKGSIDRGVPRPLHAASVGAAAPIRSQLSAIS